MHWQQALAISMGANVPTILWGDPGIGKTSFAYMLGKILNLDVEVVIASLREPSDFLGLPIVHNGEVNMAPPGWAKRLASKGEGIVFFDEMTTAPPSVQHCLLRVAIEKTVGDLQLPAAIRILGAANSSEQAGGWDLSLPLSNRFFHVAAKSPTPQDWAQGMLDGWPVPEISFEKPSVKHTQEAKTLVAGFLRVRPELLIAVPKAAERAGEGWPSPRSWEMVTKLLAHATAVRADKDMISTLVGGCVGPGTGVEFANWADKLDLPDPMTVLRDPEKKYEAPKIAATALVVVNNITNTALPLIEEGQKAQDFYTANWIVLAKTAVAGHPDVCVPPAKKLAAIGRKMGLETPSKWTKELLPLLKAAGY